MQLLLGGDQEVLTEKRVLEQRFNMQKVVRRDGISDKGHGHYIFIVE